MRWGNVTPTDLDGFIEFNDKVFVFIEVKYGDKELEYGQRLAIERLVDAIAETGRKSIGLIVQHHTHNTNNPVYLAACDLIEVRRDGEWKKIDPCKLPKYLTPWLAINNAVKM